MKFESQPEDLSEERLRELRGETEELHSPLIKVVEDYNPRSAETREFMREQLDFINSPERVVAADPEVQESLAEAAAAGSNASMLEDVTPLVVENNPKLGAQFEELGEEAEAKVYESEQDLEIAKLKTEIKELNATVQKAEVLERFGAKNGFNRDETYAFVEEKVLENEKRIKELEGNKKLLAIEAENRERQNEIARLKAEIAEFNAIVQKSETMDTFGAEHGFDKPETYAFVERKVLENEGKIRELEGSNAAPVVAPEVAPEEIPAQAAEESVMVKPEDHDAREAGPVVMEEIAPQERVGMKERELSQMEKDHLFRSYEQEKGEIKEGKEGNKIWGWIKERFKGTISFGWWEFHQAEKFRSNKKKTAENIAVAAAGIGHIGTATEMGGKGSLSLDEALEEAALIKVAVEEEGLDDPKSADYERFSQMVSGQKIERNNIQVAAITAEATATLKDKLKKYQNQFGKVVVSDESLIANFENDLSKSLLELQDGQKAVDAKEYNKIIKERLDPSYWMRYVYGAAETMLMAWGLKWAIPAIANSKWWLGKRMMSAVGEGLPVAPESTDIPMHNTIWQSAKEWLVDHGIADPSNKEVMELSKKVAIDNNIGVNEWNIPGDPMDTKMEQGHLLKFGGASRILTAIKVARGIAGII